MATRSGSGTGVIVSLVVFVFTTLMLMVMSIVFYSGQTKALQAQKEAENNLNEFVDRREQSAEWVKAAKGFADQRNVSVVGYIANDRQRSMGMLTGDPMMAPDTAQQTLSGYGVTETNSAMSALSDQRRKIADLQAEVERRNGQLSNSEAEKIGLFDQLTTTREAHQQEIEAATAKIEEYREATEQYRAQVQSALDDLAKSKDQLAQRYEGQMRDLNTEIDRLSRENVVFQSRIKEFESRLAQIRVRAADPASMVDGHIVDVAGANDRVFIDRGREQRIVLGMTFEVFDAGSRISIDPRTGELARGKASLEVRNVRDTTSECLITRSIPGRPVVRQDIIANAIYDPEYQFKFLVHGRFDLDGDSKATEKESDHLRAQIIEWGGTVISGDQIPGDLDFLVLGDEPPVPLPLRSGPSELEIRAFIEQKQAYDIYQRLKQQARDAQVPWLNSNRLLILIGHTNR